LKRLPGSTGNLWDPVASLMVDVVLKPGEDRVVTFTLGVVESRDEIKKLTTTYHALPKVDAALDRVRKRWDDLLGAAPVETPDASMDVLLNRWLPYQAIAGRLWGRTGYYQAGGAFGYRDQLQDSQIFLPIDPSMTRKQILLHARHQFKDGTVYHWWHPLSEVGLPTTMTDDLLWLPYLVDAYLQETGDDSILSAKEPFIDDPAGGTIYDHAVLAIERVLARFSPRGLPLIGTGDWNDGINAAGIKWKGESVWLGQFLYGILRSFAAVVAQRGDSARHAAFAQRAEALRSALNQHGWDGDWYIYGTTDEGQKIGSRESTAGRIHLNPQTWSVLADVASPERARAVMDKALEMLEYKAGPLLLYPAYSVPDEKIGYLTRYAPGTRENGAVYTHAATWAVIAAAKLGRPEDAYRLFRKLSPIVRGRRPKAYGAEPYVTAGNIDGPDSPFYGRGGWTWYSGSAAWLWKAGYEWILGVRASRQGLVVEPCIPHQWKRFAVTRVFRGATYRITVLNPRGASRGIQSVQIDGVQMASFVPRSAVVLPVQSAGSTHSITITMGGQKRA
jgi:cellobiose phosphorylase